MNRTLNLPMNLRDITLWRRGDLKAFLLPAEKAPPGLDAWTAPGATVNILEPFARLTVQKKFEHGGRKFSKNVTAGVVYKCDGEIAWANRGRAPKKYNRDSKWSPAKRLPRFAVRYKATVTKAEATTLRDLTSDQLKLLAVEYVLTDTPQFALDEFQPMNEADALRAWWKSHSYGPLHEGEDKDVIFLHLASAI